MTESKAPRLVERAVDVMNALVTGPQDFGTVCARVDLSKATVHRILTGLAYQEMVVQDPTTGRYQLGPGAVRLAGAASASFGPLTALARPVLEHLRSLTHETIVLHTRMGRMRINIDELISPQQLRYSGGVGSSTPIHIGSAGKVLLAWLPPATVTKLLDGHLESRTSTTITDREELLHLLEQVRRQGYAESLGERIQGLAAVSVPIFAEQGSERVVAALSVIGPEARLPAGTRADLAGTAQQAAREVTAMLEGEL